ncbi:MAG TPA: acyl-CoA synthetase [Marinospirillum sp.]|uniref:acyl-CoA synthetase n=1 Tax=Marinospirillum sp. TaxID=2183934 RepID=UPI002B475400|nr:acyl-CoA synthetase [Marinospirillum sp.]HKM15162.1 acyl-CoA synthetase [Marinospirillum sp.]
MQHTNIYNMGLNRNAANFAALTPISFLQRSASVFPNHVAQIHHDVKITWAQTYTRCIKLASALNKAGIAEGDTVAFIAPNIVPVFEAHFGVPMCGAVLNAINTRLDAEAISFILQHAEAKIIFVDREFSEVASRAIKMLGANRPRIIHIDDPFYEGGKLIGEMDYEAFLATGDEDFAYKTPSDEWDAITLNYTSGTTGNPKGVVYHHRGAYLNAVSNAVSWDMGDHPVYLWTLPMFHCNGWCFPWTIAATAGTSVSLRHVRADDIYNSIRDNEVGYFCGAPIVLNMLNNADEALKAGINHEVKVMTAGAPPPASVIEGMESMGFVVTHVYGLTETYGPCVVCAWHSEWDGKTATEKARLKSRQGVKSPMQEDLMIADPDTMIPVPKDGKTIGEIFMRGNLVMKGYLKNPRATEESFVGGWFRSGDLAVWHSDTYVEIKDRSKDIIISGGENISSVEVEDVLYRHPAVSEAAVVARPDEKWGETPCAFITLKADAKVTEKEIMDFCRENMAGFKTPKTVVFCELPKTSTGKIQKFVLRDQVKEL